MKVKRRLQTRVVGSHGPVWIWWTCVSYYYAICVCSTCETSKVISRTQDPGQALVIVETRGSLVHLGIVED